jgi:predicted  nucleic acid-binding Zn-ribbon protein
MARCLLKLIEDHARNRRWSDSLSLTTEVNPLSERIERLRSSVDGTLKTLEARAEALRAHFRLTKEKRAERINQRIQALRETLDRLRAEARRRQGLASETKQKFVTAVDELKVQISLGKAEGADRLDAERKRIRIGFRNFEGSVARLCAQSRPKVDAAAEALMHQYAHARDALNVELEAAATRLKEEARHCGAAFQKRREQLTGQAGGLQQRLADQRKRLAQKLKQFESEAKPGVEQIGKALKQLFA